MNCEEVLEMKVGGKTILEFEHSSYLSSGDTLVGASVVTEDSAGSIISLGVPNISGTKVIVLITAVASGKANVSSTTGTALGAIAIGEQKVFVK